jgi:hypothetical protein
VSSETINLRCSSPFVQANTVVHSHLFDKNQAVLTDELRIFGEQGSRACFTDSRVCTQLFCYSATSGACVAYRPAAEGSPCGPDSWCLNAKCVGKLSQRSGPLTVQTRSAVPTQRVIQVRALTDILFVLGKPT